MVDTDDRDSKSNPKLPAFRDLFKVVLVTVTDSEPDYCDRCNWREVDVEGEICDSCKAEIKEYYGID